jgi:N-acetylneuraminic acid mutarotase
MVRYKMVARDVDSNPTQFRTWVVEDEPDFTAQYYTGHKSGDNPLVDITTYAITDDTDVADFHLPEPLNWTTTYHTLPESVYGSQLAVIDGYVYLFGGIWSDRILRASLNRPAEWSDTGSTLPTPVGNSHLAILDGYIYLFGGANDGYAIDNIFKSSIEDPLTWEDTGATLPSQLQKSQLAVIDGYVYLFGGMTVNSPTDKIFKAPVTDPLSWVDTGGTLPTNLYSSHLGIIDNHCYLYGGLVSETEATEEIYVCTLDFPLIWQMVNYLPYKCYDGQFVTIGSCGYLFTPVADENDLPYTKILKCNLSGPTQFWDPVKYIPGQVSQSQLAVIDDRIYLFGGNGSSAIFFCKQNVKPALDSDDRIGYANVRKQSYSTQLDLFTILGYPPWKTDYGNF